MTKIQNPKHLYFGCEYDHFLISQYQSFGHWKLEFELYLKVDACFLEFFLGRESNSNNPIFQAPLFPQVLSIRLADPQLIQGNDPLADIRRALHHCISGGIPVKACHRILG
jgi:hypothetical protein